LLLRTTVEAALFAASTINQLIGQKLKALYKILATALVAMVAGCGGGGGSDSNTDSSPVAQVPTNPTTPTAPTAPATITNPLTGAAAQGTPTTTLYGEAYDGASVTAYNVQPDGSSGAAIGGPVTASSGVFTMTFDKAPTGWVRLVATGGTKPRMFDNAIQPGGTMQLVTPFITSSQNNLKITPVTDIAANVMAAKAKQGAALADAFTAGMRAVLGLDSANLVMLSDTTVYLNVLKGSVVSDKMYYSTQSTNSVELIYGLDMLGVALDLPTKDVARVVGDAAQADYALSGVDGSNNAINAGAWVNGTFDPAAPQTLKALMTTKLTDAVNGPSPVPRLNEYINRYLIMDNLMYKACLTGNTLLFTDRYPFYALTPQGTISAADCAAATARRDALQARVETNQSSKMK
jgi:hypothetical protein